MVLLPEDPGRAPHLQQRGQALRGAGARPGGRRQEAGLRKGPVFSIGVIFIAAISLTSLRTLPCPPGRMLSCGVTVGGW